MKVTAATELECSADEAWNFVLKPSTLQYVASPIAKIIPAGEPFPEFWQEGKTCYCKSYLFSFIPFGKRKIYFERISSVHRQIQTRESEVLIPKWDHLISIDPISENRCSYKDEVEIKAGLFTFLVWSFANYFYRHRQSRWRKKFPPRLEKLI